jgi:hypothetical protein
MNTLFDSGIYRVVENPDIKDAAIELKEETKWIGLVYQYGKVQMEDGKPNLNFQRTIRRVPHDMESTELNLEELLNNDELNTLMGEILVELIQQQADRENNEQRDIKRTD